MKAFAYVRVSTQEQSEEDRFSLPHQKEHIAEECEARGWELLEIFEDHESGKSTKKRAGFQTMLNRLNEVEVVVVHELDRLSRNVIDTLLTVEEFGKMGIKFYSIHDVIDTSDDNGELQLHIIAVFAHYFRKQLSRKVLGGMTKKAKDGGYNTKAPLGYDLVDKKLVVNESESQIINKIFDLYLDNKGIRAIAEELTMLGYRTKPTKDFPQGAPFQAFPIRKMLKNEVYIGVTSWKDERVEDTHEPIIDKDTFNKVQSRIERKNAIGGRAQASEYLLSGILRCGHCHHVMTGNKNKGRTSKKTGKAPIYKRYICNNYMKNGSCYYVWSHCADLDKQILEAIEKIIPREEAGQYINKVVDNFNPYQTEKEFTALKHILEHDFPGRYDKQVQLFERGRIDEEKLDLAFNRLKKEESEIKEKLLELERNLTLTPEAREQMRKSALANYYSVFDSGDIAKCKAWMQTNIREIRYFDKDNIEMDFYI